MHSWGTAVERWSFNAQPGPLTLYQECFRAFRAFSSCSLYAARALLQGKGGPMAYSPDLRNRVLRACDAEMEANIVAAEYEVSRA